MVRDASGPISNRDRMSGACGFVNCHQRTEAVIDRLGFDFLGERKWKWPFTSNFSERLSRSERLEMLISADCIGAGDCPACTILALERTDPSERNDPARRWQC